MSSSFAWSGICRAPGSNVAGTRCGAPEHARRATGGCYTRRPVMAVPKKKASKSRRDKRRATHKLEAPRVNECPTCHRPKRPHHVCPNCKTYKGRDIEPLTTQAP